MENSAEKFKKMKPNFRANLLTALILLLLFGTSAFAQPVRATAERKIRSAEDALNQFRDNCENPNLPEIAQTLSQANELIASAWREYEARNYVLATSFAEQALSLVLHSRSASHEQTIEQRRARRKIEETRELFQQIAPQLSVIDDNPLKNLLAQASDIISQADAEYAKSRFSVAESFAKNAFTILKKISAELHGNADPDKIAEALDKTDNLIARTSENIDAASTKKAAELIAIAKTLQADARKSFAAKQYRLSAQQTLAALKKAQEAAAISPSESSIELLRKKLETLRATCSTSSPSPAFTTSLNEAENALSRGDVKAARAALGAAKDLCSPTTSIPAEQPSRAAIEQALDLTQTLIDSKPSSQDISAAKKLQDDARKDFTNGNFSDALNKTRAARNLIESAK